MEIELNELEKNIAMCELIKSILIQTQVLIHNFSVEELKKILKKMEDKTSNLAAWPFPSTLNRSDLMKKKNDLFASIIKLIECQQEVLNHKNDFMEDDDIIKMLNI